MIEFFDIRIPGVEDEELTVIMKTLGLTGEQATYCMGTRPWEREDKYQLGFNRLCWGLKFEKYEGRDCLEVEEKLLHVIY